MKYLLSIQSIRYLIFFFLVSVSSFAQLDDQEPGGGVPTGNPGAAPIDDWIVPMLLLALVFAFYYLKNTTNTVNK